MVDEVKMLILYWKIGKACNQFTALFVYALTSFSNLELGTHSKLRLRFSALKHLPKTSVYPAASESNGLGRLRFNL